MLKKLLSLNKTNQKEALDNINELENLIDKESIDSIYPFVFEVNRDSICSGGDYVKAYVVVSYPSETKGNWLSPLKKLKGNITISQFIEPANSAELSKFYNETIKNKEAELIKTLDPLAQKKIKKQIQSAEHQLDLALSNNNAYIYIYTYILLQASNPEELKSLEENLQRILIKINLKGIIPYRKVNETFWSCLPIGKNNLPEYTYSLTNTSSASSFFPFDDNEICDLTETATIEGINKETNSYIAIDYKNPEKTLNQNKIVLGTAGGGKSTYLKANILRTLAEGNDKIFIIDPENEYSEIVSSMGGSVIDLSSASSTRINPLQIFSSELEVEIDNPKDQIESLIRQKTQSLKGFFKIMDPDIDQVKLSIISTLTTNLYENLRKVESLEQLENQKFPILEDLYLSIKKLKEEDFDRYKKIENFFYILEEYVYGASSLFNGYTNIDLKSNIVSFNLKPLQIEKEVQSAAYLNTFNYLWEHITKNKLESVKLYCDEFHFLLLNEESADFFFQAFKRFRKYRAGAIVTTQQVEDLLKAPNGIGEAIIGNSFTKVIFGLEGREVNVLIDKLKIPFSEREINFLRSKKQGEALIIYGVQRAFLQVNLTQEELRLLNPKRYQEIVNKNSKDIPLWTEKVWLPQIEIRQILEEVKN